MEDAKEQCTPQSSALQVGRITQIAWIFVICRSIFLRATEQFLQSYLGHQNASDNDKTFHCTKDARYFEFSTFPQILKATSFIK